MLVEQWLKGRPKPDRLIFRVAVRETEAWLLADHEGMREMFRSPRLKLPAEPDGLPDPKQTLLGLASKSPGALRRDLLPERGSIARQGLGYNARLTTFVRELWDPERARQRSQSLHRAMLALSALSASSRE